MIETYLVLLGQCVASINRYFKHFDELCGRPEEPFARPGGQSGIAPKAFRAESGDVSQAVTRPKSMAFIPQLLGNLVPSPSSPVARICWQRTGSMFTLDA